MIKIILWCSIIWLLPFLYVTQRNEAKFKKNIVIGVTLPNEAHEDDEVLGLLGAYKKETLWWTIFLGLCVIPCWIPSRYNWMLFAWMLWLDAIIILLQIPFVRYNGKLRELKAERGWNKRSAEDDEISVDLSVVSTPKWISPWVFAAALILTVVPAAINPANWPLYLIMALTQILFYLCYRYAFRTKSERIDGSVELTQALTQVRRSYWGRFWIKCAFYTALWSFAALLIPGHSKLYLWISIAYSLVIAFAAVRPELKIRSIQEKLTEGSGREAYVDDDDKWIWGMFYYNPKDTHAFVNSRVGMGSTVNLARPFGKFICMISVVCLVLMPAFPFMIDTAIKSEITYTADAENVSISCGRDTYTVYKDQITDVELLYDYPPDLSRTWGTATENILKGNFTAEGYGNMQVCLNPGKTPYILVKTDRRKTYLFGMGSSEEAMELYALLKPEKSQQK